jgi:isoleucyl-tRNA synthetase
MTDYRDTVFLPTTGFPMRGDLPAKEPAILARWQAMGLQAKLRAAAKGAEPFILHDGPPYANGHLHIGHALNKIHKDVINRARQMSGQDAHYIPGWDCHGLPIEWKIEEQYRKAGRDKDAVPILDFRAECRAYAAEWMRVQQEEFIRLGVEGDWAHRYATMDFAAEAAIAEEIGKFLLNGALYRGLRPVMWSPVEKTALAEAEIEYHDHKSTAIWVRFPLNDPNPLELTCAWMHQFREELCHASVVIWTTTPWTIPGNRGIAYGSEIEYVLLRVNAIEPNSLARAGEYLLVARQLVDTFCAAVGIASHGIVHTFPGSDLDLLICQHPLHESGFAGGRQLYSGYFVTTEQGTGFVHVAPSHGEEDFLLGQEHKLDVPDTVGDDGTFNAWVPLFAGLHVYKAADRVCEELEKAGALLGREEFVHSYPHSWRSKAPLIYRATPQWFIRMDGPERIRDKALAAIAQTHFVPAQGQTRLASMIAARPDWCISRQRAWGVPIAVFVHRASGEVLRDAAVMARIVEAFREEGADAWYASPPARFLGPERNPDDYEQVRDIVDVWFESGSTHAFVLQARGLSWPADLYLEGSDQHRGWFHSSLLEAIGTRGEAPFRAIVTDGFVLDEQGRKMSKSLGNVTAPQEVSDKFGADILRLWVMNADTSADLRIGPDILKQQADLYRRLRNTLRWLLGCLAGFAESERVDYAAMPELERWVLHRLAEFDRTLRAATASHDWVGVFPALHAFCNNDLSAFYFDIRKDALYCDRPDSPRRRAARTVLDQLHRCLCAWLAPVLCFTAEEAWGARFGEASSVHLQQFPTVPDAWWDDKLARRWSYIRDVRRACTNRLEEMRRTNQIRSSLEAFVGLGLPKGFIDFSPPEQWADLLIVSKVDLVEFEEFNERAETKTARYYFPLPDNSKKLQRGMADAVRASGTKCARCWRVLEEVGNNPTHPLLCERCIDAVESGLVGAAAA